MEDAYNSAMTQIFNKTRARQTRRELRRDMTDPEARLWAKLRDRRLKGIKFRRQFSIGRYVVDFYCPQAKLVVEIDGGLHFVGDAPAYDRIRNEYMKSLGLKVLRVKSQKVMKNLDGVVKLILAAVKPHPLPPSPS